MTGKEEKTLREAFDRKESDTRRGREGMGRMRAVFGEQGHGLVLVSSARPLKAKFHTHNFQSLTTAKGESAAARQDAAVPTDSYSR